MIQAFGFDGLSIMVQQDKAESPGTDFVLVKRGHRGRYRFALNQDGVRVTGEVTLGVSRASKSNDAIAIRRLVEVLSSLSERLETVQIKP